MPPAPQVISQKVGSCVAIRSILSNRFSTPCMCNDTSDWAIVRNYDLTHNTVYRTSSVRGGKNSNEKKVSPPFWAAFILSTTFMVIGTGDSSGSYFVDVTKGFKVSSATPIPATVNKTERLDTAGVCRVMRRTACHADLIQPIAQKRIDVATAFHATHALRQACNHIPRQLLPSHGGQTLLRRAQVWLFDFPLARAELPGYRKPDALIIPALPQQHLNNFWTFRVLSGQ